MSQYLFKDLSLFEKPEDGNIKIFVDNKVKQVLLSNDFDRSDRVRELRNYIFNEEVDINETLCQNDVAKDITVSLIVVTYNSEKWLKNFSDSVMSIRSDLAEIIVVDNGSSDETIYLVNQFLPDAIINTIEEPISLAQAINHGVERSTGDYLFIVNPDIVFSRSSFSVLLKAISEDTDISAAVPKLRLMKAPAFLNSVGNIVTPFRWGYDLALGHLDLGQFDEIDEIPSACFACVMIARDKWDVIGSLDPSYPLYYEDSDWSYRSRMMGYPIKLFSDSLVFHAFGGHQQNQESITKQKLRNVTYGRLRIISKYAEPWTYSYFIVSYFVFDLIYIVYSLIRMKTGFVFAIFWGWMDYFRNLLIILETRRKLNLHRREDPFRFNKRLDKMKPRIHLGHPVITYADLKEYLQMDRS